MWELHEGSSMHTVIYLHNAAEGPFPYSVISNPLPEQQHLEMPELPPLTQI